MAGSEAGTFQDFQDTAVRASFSAGSQDCGPAPASSPRRAAKVVPLRSTTEMKTETETRHR
ncbi:hypothetical protein GCM10010446_29010 [Streptomyces enissocaesilis]|uniref:Uncharacterized protein n=1 Tax=Streptomyces enissocaesilis TaxID=332589 RepID=A0ABP6JQ12_9ACTN